MTRLTPRFARVVLRAGGAIALVSAIGYFWQGFLEGKWWTIDYVFSLAIPMVIMPIAVWFMFVPRRLEYSDHEITISNILGTFTYPWSALESYGRGENVFMIQFSGDRQAYQIGSMAYSTKEWSKFEQFLQTRFPERKAAGWFGASLFRK